MDEENILVITSQPQNIIIAIGGTAVFSVEADGEDLLYQWQERSGEDAEWIDSTHAGATSSDLSIPVDEYSDGLRVRCKVSDGETEVVSDEVVLSAVPVPVITSDLTDTTVAANSSASLHIEADGGDYNTYVWEVKTAEDGEWASVSDVFEVDGDSDTLEFATNKEYEGYTFRCAVSNIAGSSMSSEASIHVIDAPIILEHPESIIVTEDDLVEFVVTASGDELIYQWQSRGTDETAWTDMEDETSDTLEIEPTLDLDGTIYRCVVRNDVAIAYTNPVTLNVYEIPVITVQPSDVSVGEGMDAQITIAATGSMLNYYWEIYASSVRRWMSVTDAFGIENDVSSITVNAELNMSGYRFRCTVSNAVGTETSETITLTVLEDPMITAHPQSAEVALGDTYAFEVEATGDNISYQWQKLGLNDREWSNVDSEDATSASLLITASDSTDQVQYRCVVQNQFNRAVSNNAMMIVIKTPVITSQPQNVNASEDGTAVFYTNVYGRSMSFQWQRRQNENALWENITDVPANTYMLRINATSRVDGYQYRCIVSNIAGTVYSNAATLKITLSRFELADEFDKKYENILPAGTYVFSLNASKEGVLYSLGFGLVGDTTWVVEDTDDPCVFYSDGIRPIRIVIGHINGANLSGCKIYPMLEAGRVPHAWISPIQRDHDIANDFNYDWLSIGNRYDSNENIVTSSLLCDLTIRYRPIWKDTL